MRSIVSAPALRKAQHSLVEVANTVDVGDDRWEDGVTFTPHGCQAIFGHVPWCPSEDKSPFYDCVAPVVVTPFLLEVGLVWQLGDLGADPKDMLSEAMDIGTSPILERLIWTGISDVVAGTPLTLRSPSGTIFAGTSIGRVMTGATQPQSITAQALTVGAATTTAGAVGLLEGKFLDSSDHIAGAGTILMSPQAAAVSGDAVVREDGDLVTRALGSKIVVGNFTPNKVVGVVGDIDVYLGDVFVLETYERSKNEWVGRAERRAAAVWNSCAVYSVDLTLT
jgi:hypothetical protein